jgi:hypothetical protein
VDHYAPVDHYALVDRYAVDHYALVDRFAVVDRSAAVDRSVAVDHCAAVDRTAAADHCAAADRTAVVDRCAVADRCEQVVHTAAMNRCAALEAAHVVQASPRWLVVRWAKALLAHVPVHSLPDALELLAGRSAPALPDVHWNPEFHSHPARRHCYRCADLNAEFRVADVKQAKGA